jgi:cytochrome c peroxidase
MKFAQLCAILFVILSSCRPDEPIVSWAAPSIGNDPKGWTPMNIPQDNQYTDERWQMGKKLFYDKRLSVNMTISCADCHDPNLAFGDDVRVSLGVDNRAGTRNVPSIANVGYHPYYTREGGLKTLEMQMLVPIQEHNEMAFNMVKLIERLEIDTLLQQMSTKAYGRKLDAFTITRSVSNFERTIVSATSSYDYFLAGDENSLSKDAKKGRELFFSDRTQCSQCHNGQNFTDYSFQNTGLYMEYKDQGRYRLTENNKDIGVFKVPSLRNLGYTAPYMHDGSFATLGGVLAHYISGGKDHPNKSKNIKPLNLDANEISQLKSFLLSLDDPDFVKNLNWR